MTTQVSRQVFWRVWWMTTALPDEIQYSDTPGNSSSVPYSDKAHAEGYAKEIAADPRVTKTWVTLERSDL